MKKKSTIQLVRELAKFTENFDIPKNRRDVSEPSNLRWLQRNMAFNNRLHENFSKAEDVLYEIIERLKNERH